MHFTGGKGGGPVGGVGGVAGAEDLAGHEVHEATGFLITGFLLVHGEADGEVGVGIDKAVDRSPLKSATILGVFVEAVEVGKGVIG